jgi:hypothetical protein
MRASFAIFATVALSTAISGLRDRKACDAEGVAAREKAAGT